ncbi:hypothetical protein ABFX02_06G059200 [Erythranthe guttata]
MDCGPYSCKPIRAFVEHPHVLLVDDCEITRKLIELLFTECACRVITSDGGVNALEYLGLADDDQSLGEYNVCTPKMKMICIDYEMPRMNGYELLKKLKESPLMEDVPVAVMASDNDPTLVKKCIEAGAVMFISKPVKEVDVEKLKTLMK